MAHYRKNMLSFFLTTKCDLACSYCYTNKNLHQSETLSYEFAQAAIVEYFSQGKSRHVRFFGAGEPTNELDLMKKIIRFAREVGGREVVVETQTHGAFIESTAEWLAGNLNIIWVSSDGLPETQNRYRRTRNGGPTSEILERNVRFLTKNSIGMVGVRSTITSQNVMKQKEMLDYFGELGVRSVWSDPVFPPVGRKQVADKPDLLTYAREFVEAQEHARKSGIFYGTFLACNFDEETEKHCRSCLPVPHLTTDGYVSACDMALFGKDTGPMSIFIYGKWNEQLRVIEYDQKKIEVLRSRTVNKITKCQKCVARLRCGGYCLGEVVNETGSLYGNKDEACDAIRYLWKHLPPYHERIRHLHP